MAIASLHAHGRVEQYVFTDQFAVSSHDSENDPEIDQLDCRESCWLGRGRPNEQHDRRWHSGVELQCHSGGLDRCVTVRRRYAVVTTKI